MKLAKENQHPFDKRIEFDEPTHIYTIDGDSSYTSVTTFLHHQFPKFDPEKVAHSLLAAKNMIRGKECANKNKYRAAAFKNIRDENNIPDAVASELLDNPNSAEFIREVKKITDEWKLSSTYGTKTHADIEYFYNGIPVENDTKEYTLFHKFNEDFKNEFPRYRPYRTEWTVFYKDLKIAGSIDMVYENMDDGTLMIYDWKRVKDIRYDSYDDECGLGVCADLPNTNFWHYSLQLNTYKAILESQYGKTVTALRLVRLYPEALSYEVYECHELKDKVNILFENRRIEMENNIECSH